MDTELLKTFLEVNRTRHFGKAAEHLCLTQSAVSARIRQLEQLLGVELFTRTRNNVQLTPEGERLLRHAEVILNTWTKAQQEIAVTGDDRCCLAVGAVPSLWAIALQDWLFALARQMPRLAVTAEAHSADVLFRRARERTLDLAFAFESPQLAELSVVPLAIIRLVMVSSHANLGAEEAVRQEDYVLVDWGTGFATAHAQAFTDAPPPRLRLGIGRLAHAYVLENGGSAYLPEAMVAADIAAGRLFPVPGAPLMERQPYAFHHRDAEQDGRLGRMLAPLRAPADLASGD
ncbi:LysR family transcriptional regulator [Thiohalocapsa marina]|uniref:LysR family transcriptional regulator n=1 Tax=Thiohalocapsa marina TaxID=424902 RepID=A0A5M8FQJ7_9GAMM|nr:LysR family transcriptional regulator [Thiohalocapsa marina]KAA6186874.1 LysR family transcriptional regulator [Thiohalocapsa marina]